MFPSPTALLVATLTLFSSALAFSPEQCNVTSYGAPTKAACDSLLTTISSLGAQNVSYLFIPSQFPTPEGFSNNTRKNFPQSWETTGCKAALVPIEVSSSSVTYDTSSYQDLASTGQVVVQECISNTTSSGGWELAGDDQDLVLHVYAAGSQIDATINKQTSTEIAATSEDEIDDAEEDDPEYDGEDDGSDDDDDDDDGDDFAGDDDGDSDDDDGSDDSDSGIAVGDSGAGSTTASHSKVSSAATASASQVSSPATTSQAAAVTSAAASAAVVESSGTFTYLGCQLDSFTARTLSSLSWTGTGLTVERCASYCSEYQYMGVEFGSQCYCGGDANGKGVKPATLVTTTPNNCTMPCNGDATQLCGGAGWLNAYQNSKSATAGATS
ncbi:hypothetical protein IMSHALPRED_001269 [Imshaugia aleurites]|uniref:WSC domain-containing protein n=1 Tax=Imshaugia aleurites TaxID=172621 RepID=A0A8H3J293_9LECA|nr:hypothetical protein IMSHALPRED_001269 [Imshaugia aleurites]